MNVSTLKLLTWATVVTAIVSALLLAALGPDLTERVGGPGAQTDHATLRQGEAPQAAATAERSAPSSH